MKEKLFPGSKDKLRATVNALQNPVLEFHRELLWNQRITESLSFSGVRVFSLLFDLHFYLGSALPYGNARDTTQKN